MNLGRSIFVGIFFGIITIAVFILFAFFMGPIYAKGIFPHS